jgi:hypothetical protein
MLLVSWQQWYEVFDRLGWKSPLPEELWRKLGGGPSRRIDWPEVFHLISTLGWSEKHAQTLWLALNNFADKLPEAADAPGIEPEAAAEETSQAQPAPWEQPVVVAKPAAPVQISTVKDPQDRRNIQ